MTEKELPSELSIETIGFAAYQRLLRGKCRSIDLSDKEYAAMRVYMIENNLDWNKIEI